MRRHTYVHEKQQQDDNDDDGDDDNNNNSNCGAIAAVIAKAIRNCTHTFGLFLPGYWCFHAALSAKQLESTAQHTHACFLFFGRFSSFSRSSSSLLFCVFASSAIRASRAHTLTLKYVKRMYYIYHKAFCMCAPFYLLSNLCLRSIFLTS